jgi:hypothetical protein
MGSPLGPTRLNLVATKTGLTMFWCATSRHWLSTGNLTLNSHQTVHLTTPPALSSATIRQQDRNLGGGLCPRGLGFFCGPWLSPLSA